MDTITIWLHNVYVVGALTGAASAALVDYRAFQSWKSFHDVAEYDWLTAAWRWTQGAVTGLLTAFGVSLAG